LIQKEVQDAFGRIDGDAVILHTDALRVGFVQRGQPLQRQMADLLQMLAEYSSGRALVFPTFNYDFCRTRVYDPMADPCQVGALNEYVRQQYAHQRTLTPVFNFCIPDRRTFPLEAVENPFSRSSTFGEMVARRAAVAFLGASFDANTFVHYVEEVMDVGYRYLKPFPGVIRRDGADHRFVLQYRVRPLIEGAVEYDWGRLARSLLDNGLLHESPLGNGGLLWFRTDRLLADWCSRVEEDELYLLTAASRKKTRELYARYGKPLRCETVESS